MEEYPTRWTCPEEEAVEVSTREEAVRFMLHVITATVYASSEDYDQAVVDFFAQLEALGHLIGASDIDEVARFIRRRSRC